MIPNGLLKLLICPLTGQPLREATSEELKAFDEGLTEGLIREDGLVLYPVRDEIPLLVPGAAISPKA
ncbi:MAG: Trm112 family protein [Verrucomicrobiota bacterium]